MCIGVRNVPINALANGKSAGFGVARAPAVKFDRGKLDPDLRQQAVGIALGSIGKGGDVQNHLAQQQKLMVEQAKRDELRAANTQLAEQRQAEQARVNEAQKQAKVQQQAEIQRQGELQQQAEQARVAQEQQLGREKVATQAMSQSMRVLGASNQPAVAPTAAVSKKTRTRNKARATSATQSLRIGSSGQSPGAGLNLGA